MKRSAGRRSWILGPCLLIVAFQAYPCSWAEGYFHRVSRLRGNIVGADIGPLQYVHWLRQSFARRNARITLYEYHRPIKQRDDMPLVITTKTDVNGYFDFGEVGSGHYTLVVDDDDWQSSDWFDVEVNQEAKETVAVLIDVSPHFPDCKGGHEFIVLDSARRFRWEHMISWTVALVSFSIAFWYFWNRRRRPIDPSGG